MSHFKKISLAVCAYFIFGLCAIPGVFAGEDIYYLENEIKDVQRQLAPVDAETGRADKFLKEYNANVAALQDAYNQMDDLETRQRSLLQKNLIKSTIVLGLETYGKINLVMGFYQQSVKKIILAIGSELISNEMQSSFSSPYKVAVKGLSEDAQKLLPEIKEIQKTLALSQDEVREAALKEGDKLGDTGVIYRKFQMTLEAIEKAKKALYQLRKSLDSTKLSVEASLPQLKEIQERLQKKVNELRDRLSKAYRDKEVEQSQALSQEVQSQAQVKLSPVPMGVSDEEKRRAMVAERQSRLTSIVNGERKKLEEIGQKMNESFTTVNQYSGVVFSPLSSGPYVLAAVDYSLEDMALMDPLQIRSEQKWYKSRIPENQAYIKKLESFIDQYEGLETDLKDQGIPILNELAGLGAGEGWSGFSDLLKSIVWTYNSAEQFIEKFNKEIEIFKNLDPRFDQAFNKKVSDARSFIGPFETAATNAIEAASFVAKKANEAADMYEVYVSRRKNKNVSDIGNVQQEVKSILAAGKGTAEARNLLLQKKAEIEPIYKAFAPLQRLKIQRDNAYSDVVMNFVNTAENANLKTLVAQFPGEGLKDVQGWFEGQYFQFLSSSKINDNLAFGVSYANELFYTINAINDFLPVLALIETADTQIREAYNSLDLKKAGEKRLEIMKDLNQSDEVLSKWVDASKGIDGVKFYKIISNETTQAMKNANLRYTKAEEEKSRKAQEELKRQQEEKSKEYLKKANPADYYGYRILNPRVNSYSVDGASGDIVVTKDKLVTGQIQLTGRMANMENVKTILISEDGGRSWQQLPKSADIVYSFTPIPGKLYNPMIQVKTEDFLEANLMFASGSTGLVYKDEDFSQQVVAAVQAFAEAYERTDMGTISRMISRNYLGNKTFLEEGIRFDFDMFVDIRLTIYINRIEQRGEMFVAETKWDKSQTPRKTGQTQMTSGQTLMMFVLEDNQLKIQNLRGNLIVATLSPEIAQASGLNATIVDQIRTAENERNPVQPGAGTTEDSGGVTSSSGTLTTQTAAITSNGAVNQSFDFSASSVSDVSTLGDLYLETNSFWMNGSAKIALSATDYSSLTTAPDSITETTIFGLVVNQTYVFITNEGYYGKLKIISLVEAPVGLHTLQFQYVVQTDLTKNIAT